MKKYRVCVGLRGYVEIEAVSFSHAYDLIVNNEIDWISDLDVDTESVDVIDTEELPEDYEELSKDYE
jgi:hypothetical protein